MDYREKILKIRNDYLQGKMTLDEAKSIVQPLLDDMNVKGTNIAKKHGRKFNKLTFGYVFR